MSGVIPQTDGPFEPDPDHTGVGIGRIEFNLSTFRVSLTTGVPICKDGAPIREALHVDQDIDIHTGAGAV